VEIVDGGVGRRYVVLPTGVETGMPFACNAPFIQDPARLYIKDPETSPTNRLLLERGGRLAAEAMLKWLQIPSLAISERAEAYGLFPEKPSEGANIEDSCADIVAEAFAERVKDEPLLLTQDGGVTRAHESVA